MKIQEDKEGRSLAQIKELYPENSMKAKLYWPSEQSTAICTQMQHYVKWIPEPGCGVEMKKLNNLKDITNENT